MYSDLCDFLASELSKLFFARKSASLLPNLRILSQHQQPTANSTLHPPLYLTRNSLLVHRHGNGSQTEVVFG